MATETFFTFPPPPPPQRATTPGFDAAAVDKLAVLRGRLHDSDDESDDDEPDWECVVCKRTNDSKRRECRVCFTSRDYGKKPPPLAPPLPDAPEGLGELLLAGLEERAKALEDREEERERRADLLKDVHFDVVDASCDDPSDSEEEDDDEGNKTLAQIVAARARRRPKSERVPEEEEEEKKTEPEPEEEKTKPAPPRMEKKKKIKPAPRVTLPEARPADPPRDTVAELRRDARALRREYDRLRQRTRELELLGPRPDESPSAEAARLRATAAKCELETTEALRLVVKLVGRDAARHLDVKAILRDIR